MERVPLDVLEIKLGFLNQIIDLSEMTSTDICKLMAANYNIDCTEQEVRMLITPNFTTVVDEAIITYKDII